MQPNPSSTEAAPAQKAEVAAENVMTVAKDQRYARYLKMVQVVSIQHFYSWWGVFCVLTLWLILGGTSDGHSE